MPKPNINDVCDYIIHRASAGGVSLSLIKLQKLLYYVQAWNLAFSKKTLFEGKFEAWVHGPVNRPVYDRFAKTKSLYSLMDEDDVIDSLSQVHDRVSEVDRGAIESVLEVYIPFTGTQLEEMTHKESPWQEARKGYLDYERCDNELSEQTMQSYYAARLGA